MKTFLFLSLASFIVSNQANATVNVIGDLSGSARADISFKVHYRHSLDCYPTGKGSHYEKLPFQSLSFSGTKTIENQGVVTWSSHISDPFKRIARAVNLRSSVTESYEATDVSLTLNEERGAADEQYASGSCWHKDGQLVVNNASVKGSVKVQYTVPDNVWAVSVSRDQGEGLLSNYGTMKGALNQEYDEGQQDGVVLWVRPGQTLEQEITINESIPGGLNLGRTKMSFKPITSIMNFGTFIEFKKALKRGDFFDMTDSKKASLFIHHSLGIVRMGKEVQGFVKDTNILELKQMSDELFEIANSLIPYSFPKDKDSEIKPDGMAIKTAAALAAYQLSKALLVDLQSYCQEVEVNLPFTGQKQKVLGLRAASFWLSRSMGLVKSYSYNPIETFLMELQTLQKNGMSPADIVGNKDLADKLRTSYQLLTRSGALDQSPFNIAYVDMNRMLEVFKELGTVGSNQKSIIDQLEVGSQLEGEFVKNFVRTVLLFKKNRTDSVNMDELLNSISDLKKRQVQIESTMRNSIRLLSLNDSEDKNQILNQITSLLNRQINIFSESLDIPYFEKIRAEFMKNQVTNLEQSVQGCFGTGGN